MLHLVKRTVSSCFLRIEAVFDRAFGAAWNPFHNLGALAVLMFWVVAVSGIYLFIFFETSATDAYPSVEYLTVEQWYAGGVMRSLHRYASDAMVLLAVLHLVREFAFDRYRGVRWFAWITGLPILVLLYTSGITGYWLVWDVLAQYIAIASTEWLDTLNLFGASIARNFLAPGYLSDRFFTLLVFVHIAAPLFLLFASWIHVLRVSQPKTNPPRGLAAGTLIALIVASFVSPATSQAPANLGAVPGDLAFDWFYLVAYPAIDHFPGRAVWSVAAAAAVMFIALPWLPPLRRAEAAVVNLAACNGCGRCADDCPFAAITMRPRTDGLPFFQQAEVDADRCTSCGVCVGACPTGSPFQRRSALRAGIEVPYLTLDTLRTRTHAAVDGGASPRILVYRCAHAASAPGGNDLAVSLDVPCIGMVPPPFVDYALSRTRATGVVLLGCRECDCHNRLGVEWTSARIAGARDPHLRARVPRERLATVWAARTDAAAAHGAIAAFAERLAKPESAPPASTANPGATPVREVTDA
jgi:ferredoxin/coenzyme F420-reducing hydrogenase delta subunit